MIYLAPTCPLWGKMYGQNGQNAIFRDLTIHFFPKGAGGGKRYHVQGQFLVWLMLKLRWVQLFLPSRLIRPDYISTNPQYWQYFLCFFKHIPTLRRFLSKTTGLQRLVLGSLERGRSLLSFWRLGGAFLSCENHVRGLRPLKPPFFRQISI